jgi:hypothetical protein
MFTYQQIEEVIRSIDYHYSMIIGINLGTDILTFEDRLLLQNYGVDIDKLVESYPPYLRMFYLGRLSSILRDEQLRLLNINDFNIYLKQGQFIPLSKREKKEYEISREITYNHIKGLGRRSSDGVRDIMLEVNRKNILKEEISEGIEKRRTIKQVISEIGHKTEDWNRDWHRIVETEMANIYNQGIISGLLEKYGENHKVYKQVYQQACRHCIRLYTTNGINSEPRVFTLKEIIGNGSNIGRKVNDWLAVVDATHPFCRCHIYSVFPNQVWNEGLQGFVYTKQDESKWSEGVIKIKVGNKELITN